MESENTVLYIRIGGVDLIQRSHNVNALILEINLFILNFRQSLKVHKKS